MDQEKFAQSDLKVLLVEDDREFADILRIRLSKETNPRLAITCLPTLQQAQQALTETTWDLILLDLMLPKIDGYRVCGMLKFDKNFRNTPIIILTARAAESDKEMGKEAGADLYLTKPFEPDVLIAKVKDLLKADVRDIGT